MAKEETTRSLSKRLQNVKTTAEANTFVEAQATNREAFHEMLQAQLCRKGMEIKDLLEIDADADLLSAAVAKLAKPLQEMIKGDR